MLILGITNNDTAGACLVHNDRILSAVHEERFTRKKKHKIWPHQSIDFVLGKNGFTINDIDMIAYGWKAGFNEDYCLNLYVDRIVTECIRNPDNIDALQKRVSDELENDRETRAEFDRFIVTHHLKNKVRYIDHHDSHAWGAWLCSQTEKSLVVTSDGRGDFQSLTIRLIDKGQEIVLQRETTIDSLGYFYGRITHLLGFTPNKHEGKVTGLAAHGDPQPALPLMHNMIDMVGQRLIANCGDYYQPSYHGYSDRLLKEIVKYAKQDIAAAAQFHLESIISCLITPYIKQFNISNVCLAGGIFGNVKLNQKVRQIAGVNNIFVLPCMGDKGLPLAAAVTAAWRENAVRCNLETMALGPDFSDEYIHNLLKNTDDLDCIQPNNISDIAIDMLQSNCILGLVRGQMEFGPRALCHRSIIYHAQDPSLNKWLNDKLQRTEFMPFAPVTTENLADICFKDWKKGDTAAEYMTITYDCHPILKEKCPAVVHTDNTARPQIIKKDRDPFMYQLINRWWELTGQPCLVNTSFNRHEEPIINTPEQGLSVLRNDIVHAVIINDKFIFRKKDVNYED